MLVVLSENHYVDDYERKTHPVMKKIYIFKEVIEMKEMFGKGFGLICGIWGGFASINFLDELLPEDKQVYQGRNKPEKEESDFEEES